MPHDAIEMYKSETAEVTWMYTLKWLARQSTVHRYKNLITQLLFNLTDQESRNRNIQHVP
ncbi:hypothetical protein E4U17_006192, partial [Claviceps sp. LM77 group G4]